MPLPWIIVIVAKALLAGVGTGLATYFIGGVIEAIIAEWKGKKLAVLGARGVGKTTLVQFLSSGSLPAEYKQTVAPEKVKSRRFQLRELDLKIKETLDVSGSKAAYAEWKELVDQADVVLYLLRADRLFARDAEVEARIRNDLHHIGGWLDGRSERPRFFIIGTHCDLDNEYRALSDDRVGDYTDKFYKLPIVSEMVALGGGSKVTKVIIGSTETIQATEALAYQIFKQVKS